MITQDTSVAPKLLELTRNSKGELIARVSGREEPVQDVRVARCFPWSFPESLVSVRDKEGEELVLLETLDGLPAETQDLIEKELADKIFAPRIHKILKYEHRFGTFTIVAETDRGEVTFHMRNREDARFLTSSRVIFKDADGNMYEVPDLATLDIASQRHISEFL